MGYDIEKYRLKREKVLGVKKRGMPFASMAVLFTLGIFITVGWVVLPQAIAYIKNRNLDDVIFRVEGSTPWNEQSVVAMTSQEGVEDIKIETENNRVIITLNREVIGPEEIKQILKKHGKDGVLLNVIGHSQRLKIVAEEAKFEAL